MTGTTGKSWGKAVDGLRIGITPRVGSGPGAVQFDIALENTGTTDFVVNLGLMLANGKIMHPSAIQLALTDASGRAQTLVWSGPAAIAGRLDDYPVALQAGSVHVFRMPVDKIWNNSAIDQLSLTPGRYRITARFDGRGAQLVNLDTPGIKLMNFWTGTVESSTAEFTIAK